MMKSRRILLNAEPFGFGPAAAIATIAPLLQQEGIEVGYIGEGHSHDLQQAIAYRDRYDLSGLSAVERHTVWERAATEYDFFLSAMDFAAAKAAKKAGMKVAIYDALAWYWPEIPTAAKQAELYVAQDFFGVRQRLRNEARPPDKTSIVPPLTTPAARAESPELTLLNLGGLQNPFWQLADATTYAHTMISAVREVIPADKLIIATSAAIASRLQVPGVKTYSNAALQEILAHTKQAIMTPGLGNIYDAAAYNIPTLWLPPANDSQGRQLTLLKQHRCLDTAITWEDIIARVEFTKPQTQVLAEITANVRALRAGKPRGGRLSRLIEERLTVIGGQTVSRGASLLELFGSNGAPLIARQLSALLKPV